MIKTPVRFLLFASLITAPSAWAGNLPEVIGFDAANEAAAQIFSSPALPSLDNEGMSITPIYGIVKMEGQDETVSYASGPQDGQEFTIQNRGELSGEVAGLTFNYSGQGNLGFFGTAAWSRVGGDLTATQPEIVNEIKDISAQTYIGVVGLNYRAVGTSKSFFALGFFGGPAVINAKTSARIIHSDGTWTRVKLDPETTAVYFGLQMMFRPGQFRINPYLNFLANPSLGCFKPSYEGDPYPAGQYNRCSNGEPGVTAFAAIAGIGVNVGYGRFQFGLLHGGDGGNPAFKTSPLVFSLRIGL